MKNQEVDRETTIEILFLNLHSKKYVVSVKLSRIRSDLFATIGDYCWITIEKVQHEKCSSSLIFEQGSICETRAGPNCHQTRRGMVFFVEFKFIFYQTAIFGQRDNFRSI